MKAINVVIQSIVGFTLLRRHHEAWINLQELIITAGEPNSEPTYKPGQPCPTKSGYIRLKTKRNAQIQLVASCHDTTRRASRDVRAAPGFVKHGGRRKSSSARVSNDIMFYYYLLFQLTNEIHSFIETNYDDHNFIHIIK